MQFQRNSRVPHRSPPQANELLWTLSPHAIFEFFSPRLGRFTGWDQADWLGKPLQSFIHPSDIRDIRDRFAEVLGGRTLTFEKIRGLMKDGSYSYWSLSLVPRDEGDGVSEVLVLGYPEDGELGPAEQRVRPPSAPGLQRENDPRSSSAVMEYAGLAKLLEGMLGNAPIGFALLDEQLRFICLNQTFSEMTRFSPSQQLGHPIRDLLPQVAQLLEPVMQNVLAAGESIIDFEVEFPKASGVESYRFSQMNFYPIPDLHGGVCGVAAIAVDITDRKSSEAKLKAISDELVRSNLALEQFSYIASHDLKEPLRTITSFVQLLKERYQTKLDKDADEFINHAVDGAKRMHNLIGKIMEYSLAGKMDRGVATVNCSAIVQAIVENLKVALDEAGAKVTHESLPIVQGDETLLYQVFQNLMANALKFRGPSLPEVRVNAKRELNTWVFSVADNGIGISPDQFVNIFSPFRKLHSHSEYEGSGLGLAICQKNVERLGGRIWVTSELGKGSVFSFTIPASHPGGESSDEITK